MPRVGPVACTAHRIASRTRAPRQRSYKRPEGERDPGGVLPLVGGFGHALPCGSNVRKPTTGGSTGSVVTQTSFGTPLFTKHGGGYVKSVTSLSLAGAIAIAHMGGAVPASAQSVASPAG